MSNEAELLPGTLDLLILKAASLGPLHGYAMLTRIRQISGETLFIEQGALAFERWFGFAPDRDLMRRAIASPGSAQPASA